MQVPGLVGSPSAKAVTLPAGRAVRTHLRAGVVVKGHSVIGDLNQFAFLRKGRSVVITFTTADAAAKKTAPVIARASKSIRFGCSGASADPLADLPVSGSGDDAEARPLLRHLEELRVPAADLVDSVLVAGADLGAAHRQRGTTRADGAEPIATSLRGLEQVEVDLDVEDLLQAPHVRVAPRLVRVDERAGPLDARTWVDDLVAEHVAAAALDLVLRPQRQLRADETGGGDVAHSGIVAGAERPPQDLTWRRDEASPLVTRLHKSAAGGSAGLRKCPPTRAG